MRWTDVNGTLQMTRLNPSAAAADGSSATLLIPQYANGVFALQVFGSSSQPLLQIVPTITAVDVQDRTVIFGSGFVEGAGLYGFAGTNVTDAQVNTTIDVWYNAPTSVQNGSAYLTRTALPAHGLGNVVVATAGGTSAAFALNTIRTTVNNTNPSLGDLAVDAAGNIWVSDMETSPNGRLHKIDAATGQVLQTINLNATDFGLPYTANYSGLQILTSAMTLNGVAVPAGSLLVFNGYPNTDRVTAINPATGAVLATRALATNYDLTGGVYDPGTGLLFVARSNGGSGSDVVAVNPATGAEVATTTTGINVTSWSGLAIQPSTGHLWLGSVNGGPQVIEYLINAGGTLTELRRVDLAGQGLNQNEISGLSFAPDGKLYVASTQGEIYVVTV